MIDKNDPKITAFVMGELNQSESAEIEAQLAASSELREAVDELRHTAGLIESGYQNEAQPPLPDDAKKEIEAAAGPKVQPSKTTDPVSTGQVKKRFGSRIAIAASLLIALGGSIWIFSMPSVQNKVAKVFLQEIDGSLDQETSSKMSSGKRGEAGQPSSMQFYNLRQDSANNAITSPDDEFGELKREINETIQADSWTDPDSSIAPYPSSLSLLVEQSQGESGDSSGRDSILVLRGGESRSVPFIANGEIFDDEAVTESSVAERLDFTEKSLKEMEIPPLPASVRPAKTRDEDIVGPVTIETVDDLGFLVLKGTPEDVARVQAVIEELVSGNSDNIAENDGKLAPDGRLSESYFELARKYSQGQIQDSKLSPQQKQVLDSLKVAVDDHEKKQKQKSWKRVKAIPNTSRLMVGDHEELDMQGMQVNVQIDGFRARVLIDCFYYNDRSRQLEGSFKLRLPDDASLYYFAFGESRFNYDTPRKGDEFTIDDGEFLGGEGVRLVSFEPGEIKAARQDAWDKVKEARVVPREKAAFAYGQTVKRRVDPALVEWAGAGVFNAKVYPLMPHKLHRIVIGYDVNLVKDGDHWTYDLALPEQTGRCEVDLAVTHPDDMPVEISPRNRGSRGEGVSRFNYDNPVAPIQVRLPANENVMLFGGDEETGEYFATQFTPELKSEASAGASQAIFLVDTSLSSQPEKFNVWLKMLESTLNSNRDSLKQFAVIFFDVEARWWREEYIDNTPEHVAALLADCNQVALEGATDLYAAVRLAAIAGWASPQEDSGQQPDVFLLSDGAATWGETNLRLIDKLVSDSNLGNVFAYQTGLSGTAVRSLRFLAGRNGGAVFSVTTEEEIATASTAHRKRPWELVDINVDGANDVLTAGRIQWVYPGQAISVVGRGFPTGSIDLTLKQADQTKMISIQPERKIDSDLASRLYGQVAVGQLESLGSPLADFSAAYARQFRITGQTCSLLMLESQADYERFNIKPEDDLFVVRSKKASELISTKLEQLSGELADPKAQLLSWLEKLETAPGLNFKIPMPLKLAMEDMSLNVVSSQLKCKSHSKKDVGEKYLQLIDAERLDYDRIVRFAKQREQDFSASDAIKVLSNLVERNPGDIMIARDVAYSAIEWEQPDQAYPLLKRVAMARPFEGNVYLAMGQCLQQMEQVDLAMVFYEIAVSADFNARHRDFTRIATVEYFNLLREVNEGMQMTSVPEYAKARYESLAHVIENKEADVVVTMLWNTDRTDVDLHITEPSGETCNYQNNLTKSGGRITADITDGYGPEMYVMPSGSPGNYEVKVKYYGSDTNRASLRSKVYLTIYEAFGTARQKITRKTVRLDNIQSLETVATVKVK